jgi:hypothetical protein
MTDTISINDIGTDLQITITESGAAVDISAATALAVILKKPSGVEVTKTALLLNDGTDGVLHYTTVSGDIDETGTWSYRGRVTFSAAQVYHSIDPQTFIVI